MMAGVFIVLALGIVLGAILGFGGGYYVREVISQRRRAREKERAAW